MSHLTLSKLIAQLWGKLMLEREFGDAALVANLGLLLSKHRADRELETGSFVLLRKALAEMQEGEPNLNERGTTACSFCGRQEPEVRLAAGSSTFICNECVKLLHDEVFNPPED